MSGERITGLGATRDFHHGLLAPALVTVFDNLKPVGRAVLDLITGFGTLPDWVRSTAIAFVGLTAAGGPMLVVLGIAIKNIAVLGTTSTVATGGVGTLTTATSALGVAMGILGKGVAVVAVAVGTWQVGKWVGEVTGLTNVVENLAGKYLFGLTPAQIEAGRTARSQAEALGEVKVAALDAKTGVTELANTLPVLVDQFRTATIAAAELTRATTAGFFARVGEGIGGVATTVPIAPGAAVPLPVDSGLAVPTGFQGVGSPALVIGTKAPAPAAAAATGGSFADRFRAGSHFLAAGTGGGETISTPFASRLPTVLGPISSGGPGKVVIERGAITINWPVMNDPGALEQIERVFGDAIMRVLKRERALPSN